MDREGLSMDDLISRQAAIEEIFNEPLYESGMKERTAIAVVLAIYEKIKSLSPTQPEITDEQAIEHLRSTGWMQNHDREMYDMGLKEQLADDSGSYDSLLPSAQPEIIRCRDCKHYDGRPCGIVDWYNTADDFCSRAEGRTDGE